MSTLVRSAKAGKSWTADDLRAFNIQVVAEDTQTFFGVPDLPAPDVPSTIWDKVSEPHNYEGLLTFTEAGFFSYLREVMERPSEVSAVRDYVGFLLSELGFNCKERVTHSGENIQFTMCGKDVSAKPDMAVIDHPGVEKYLLLIKLQHKNSKKHPEPQLVATAIAAFSQNNLCRKEAHLSDLSSQSFLGIIVVGTAPEFYKITITQELVSSVATGEYPPQPTVVKKLLLPVSDLNEYNSQGMLPLANRRFALKCFEACKQALDDSV